MRVFTESAHGRRACKTPDWPAGGAQRSVTMDQMIKKTNVMPSMTNLTVLLTCDSRRWCFGPRRSKAGQKWLRSIGEIVRPDALA